MMKKLNDNWITEGLIDFEYKKYILMAYLQEVEKNFNDKKLYPFLSDMVEHYNNMIHLKESKSLVEKHFPKQISKIDVQNFKIEFERLLEDDKCLIEVESILDFAIPLMKEHLKEGKDIYQFVEDKLNIFPVGIIPLNTEMGYLFLIGSKSKDTIVYEYQITIFENANERYRGINTEYVSIFSRSITNTFENIKLDLIKTYKRFANPGTYVVESKMSFPIRETLLPIAKMSLVRYLETGNKVY
jgi:hypothetical protein